MTTITETKNNINKPTISPTTISPTNMSCIKHNDKKISKNESIDIQDFGSCNDDSSDDEPKHNDKKFIKNESIDIQDFGSSDDEPILKNKKSPNKQTNHKISPKHSEVNSENISTSRKFTILVYRKINDNYSIAKYHDFDVTIDTTSGYINATKLCSDGGKDIKDWFMNDFNQELIGSYIINSSNDTETSGTYVHPKLITYITSWVYPSFAWKVSEIVNNHIIKEIDNHITLSSYTSRLEKMFEESEKRREESDKLNKQLLDNIMDQNQINISKLDKIHLKIYKNTDILKRLESRVEKIVEEVVPPTKQLSLHECFGIMKLNCPYSNKQYKVYYGTEKHINKALGSIRKRYRRSTILKEVGPYPNAHNFLRQIKEKYGSSGRKSKLQISDNFINLNYKTTEQDLINILDEVIENNKNCIN
jgi:hypothetical protein